MTIYLTIITTVLVLTQIIRIAQNHIQLKKQKTLFEEELGQISDITEDDLREQRETYKMLHEYLLKKLYSGDCNETD